MKKTIVVFSNPFGYGPTGVAIPILLSLLERTTNTEVIFAGSSFCMEIMTSISVKKVFLNERDEVEIISFLSTLINPFVIGSQNRFCIKAAKKLNIPCAFIDILAWFWLEIPPDHLLADHIFWMKFPGIEKKIPHASHNIHLVSGIVRKFSEEKKNITNDKLLLINIGGAKYPPLNEVPRYYLNLIAKGLNAIETNNVYEKIIFSGGEDALEYLKGIVTNKKVFITKDNYLRNLSNSSHLMTCAGVSSTFEAFFQGVPVSFLLPLNLSQVGLAKVLSENNQTSDFLDWSRYVAVRTDLEKMKESEAVLEIARYTKLVDESKGLSNQFVEDFIRMSNMIPDKFKQEKFIRDMGGASGADEVVDFLCKNWEL